MANLNLQNSLSLQERCYPTRSALPSCIRLPAPSGNFEIKPQFVNMLPKFTGHDSEDAYIFISEFEEVCSMMRYDQLSEDALKLKFVPFALKENAKKWLYSIPSQSIGTWNEFTKVFLKKFYPHHKTARIRFEINQFCQIKGENFWQYFERFKDLLTQCPHHAIEKWRLCQIVYEGLDFKTKSMLESMCQGDFMRKNEDEAWIFLEDLSNKTNQWENTHGMTIQEHILTQRGGNHSDNNSIAAREKFDSLSKRLDALESNTSPSHQIQQNACIYCHNTSHFSEHCNFAPHKNVNATFQNDPFLQNFNQGWQNQQNFSWNQGYNFNNQNFQNQGFQNPSFQNNFQRPFVQQNVPFQQNVFQNQQPPHASLNNVSVSQNVPQNDKLSSLEKSLELLVKTVAESNATFTQTTQTLAQNISKMEQQMGQLGNQLNEIEKETGQPELWDPHSHHVHQIQNDPFNSINAVAVFETGKTIYENEVIHFDSFDFDPLEPETHASDPSAISQSSPPPSPVRLKENNVFEDLFDNEPEIIENLGQLSDHIILEPITTPLVETLENIVHNEIEIVPDEIKFTEDSGLLSLGKTLEPEPIPLISSFEVIFKDKLNFSENLGQTPLETFHKPQTEPLIFEDSISESPPQHVFKPIAKHIIQNMLEKVVKSCTYLWPTFTASDPPVEQQRFIPVDAVRKENFKVD